jgi:hypothetical protein
MNTIHQDLDALGRGSDDVAQKLSSLGIQGGHNGSNCPIFHYLSSKGHIPVSVTATQILYRTKGAAHYCEPRLPVAMFIHRFDVGEYPHLESKS